MKRGNSGDGVLELMGIVWGYNKARIQFIYATWWTTLRSDRQNPVENGREAKIKHFVPHDNFDWYTVTIAP